MNTDKTDLEKKNNRVESTVKAPNQQGKSTDAKPKMDTPIQASPDSATNPVRATNADSAAADSVKIVEKDKKPFDNSPREQRI